jgi:predicted ATPase
MELANIYVNFVQIPLYQEGLQDKLEKLGLQYNCICTEHSVNHLMFESLNENDLRMFNATINANSNDYFNAKACYSHKYHSENNNQIQYIQTMMERLSKHYNVA